MQSNDQIYKAFSSLWSDFHSEMNFPTERPLLSHYTSIATLECILRNDEVWFSNPLNMNDFEELRFGVIESAKAFRLSERIESCCGATNRYEALSKNFEVKFAQFDSEHALDIYVFCMAKHDDTNDDGVLSMWRGYGENGGGAAIVIDMSKLALVPGSPIIMSKVTYMSSDARLKWIHNKLDEFATLIQVNNPSEDQFHIAIDQLFARIVSFALFTKHQGFEEEKEWRAVYMRDRDLTGLYESMLGYSIGKRGIEPKFKYSVKPLEGSPNQDVSMEKVIHKIILGPSAAGALSIEATRRMFEKVGKKSLVSKLVPSSVPYRGS